MKSTNITEEEALEFAYEVMRKRVAEPLQGNPHPPKVRKTTPSKGALTYSAALTAIKVGAVSTDPQKPHFSQEEGDTLREAIIDYVAIVIDLELRPTFHGIQNRVGFLLVMAHDDNTEKWLFKHAEGIAASCNLPFKFVKGDEIPNTCLMRGHLPRANILEDSKILTFLECQNYDIHARRWRIVSKTPAENGIDATCTISMDDASAATVKDKGFFLSYRTGHVRLYHVNSKTNNSQPEEEGEEGPKGESEVMDVEAPPTGGIPKIVVEQLLEVPNKPSPKPPSPVPSSSKTIQTTMMEHLNPVAKAGGSKATTAGAAREAKKSVAARLTPPTGGITPVPAERPPLTVPTTEGLTSPIKQGKKKALKTKPHPPTATPAKTKTTRSGKKTIITSHVECMDESFSEEEFLLNSPN